MRPDRVRPSLCSAPKIVAVAILVPQNDTAALTTAFNGPGRITTMLTADMKRIVTEHPLGYVATAAADGTPNLSPKGTFFVVDDATIAFAEIRSPATMRNLQTNPRIEVNFVDPFVRKGYRFAGTAKVLPRGEGDFDALLKKSGSSLAPRVRAMVVISVTKALPLVSPAYDDGTATEEKIRKSWTARFRKLQPGERFEE
jgi:predicted pyridoxine 5'-phosphate oxidase superfamily flavin-nucleotide-binding protein